MKSRHFARLLPSLMLLTLLLACGGNSNNASNNSGSSNTPTPGSSNTGGGSGSGSGGSSSSGTEYVYGVSQAATDQSTFTLYKMDTGTGVLTKVTSATIPVRAANMILADSTGFNAYVTGFEAPSPNMDLVKVTPSSGSISPFPGETFQSVTQNEGNCCPSALAVDSSGVNTYVGGLNDGSVHFYSVDKSSGVWTEKATYRQNGAGGEVYALALTPAGNFLYTSQRSASVVSGFARAADGSLTPIPGSPFNTSGLTSTVSTSPDGKWLFVPHYELAAFDIFRINSDGTLTMSQANVAAGNAPHLATTDPQERFLYVSNSGAYGGAGSPSISAYKFDATAGMATPVSGSPFVTKQAQQIVVDPSGKFLYAPAAPVEAFSIDQSTGALTPVSGSFPSEGAIAIVKP
jgi:6-phosphogluconolactonase (cycloisomerase 2 family)